VCAWCVKRGWECEPSWHFVSKGIPLRCKRCILGHQHCSLKELDWGVSAWPTIKQNRKGAETQAKNAARKDLVRVMSSAKPLGVNCMVLWDISRFGLLPADTNRSLRSVEKAIKDLREGIKRDEANLEAVVEVISKRCRKLESWIKDFEEDLVQLREVEAEVDEVMVEVVVLSRGDGSESVDDEDMGEDENDDESEEEYKEWHGFGSRSAEVEKEEVSKESEAESVEEVGEEIIEDSEDGGESVGA